ncbi:thiamine-phosphate kinase [Dongia mobilis]|uniref:thiamine-phosphate kinase n=1 Tax=Dongia mobilis TaxID=578943 RepID=UPI001FB6E9F8|nr:thiamine-phosphate kinase [Dongia mobilis]
MPGASELPGEFDLIARYFAPLSAGMPGALGLTDDACTYAPPPGYDLVLTVDAMVAGIHFLPDDPAASVARKLLRVNLSDLAAKGAMPVGYLMTTAFTAETDADWVAGFAAGLAADQREYGIGLMGGDTIATPGPLSLTLTALGIVPTGRALRRNGARPGDVVLVSGTIGDGALGLKVLRHEFLDLPPAERRFLEDRYHLPQPRLRLGQALLASNLVHAMMDVSDGLVGDLGHIAEASGVGAILEAAAVPLSAAAAGLLADAPDLLPLILTGGDDYELLLTAAPDAVNDLLALGAEIGTPLSVVGCIPGHAAGERPVRVIDRDGVELNLATGGYRHF